MPVASVSVAVLVPDAPPATLEVVRPAIVGLVASAKLDADTPLAKVKPLGSVTVSRALSRFASVSVAGLAVTVGRGRTSTWNVSVAWSAAARFASASCAVTVTVCAPLVTVVGVPQNSLGSVPGQVPAPSASNTRPAGRPETA